MLLLSTLPLRARLIRDYTESLRLTSPEGLLAALPSPAFPQPRTAYCHPAAWPPDNRLAMLDSGGAGDRPADHN